MDVLLTIGMVLVVIWMVLVGLMLYPIWLFGTATLTLILICLLIFAGPVAVLGAWPLNALCVAGWLYLGAANWLLKRPTK